MSCLQFENRIHELLDDRRSLHTDPLLLDHARSCTACQELLNDYCWLQPVAFANADNLRARVAAVADLKLKRRTGSRRPVTKAVFAAAGIAAALLLVLSFAGWNQPNDGFDALTWNDPVAEVAVSAETQLLLAESDLNVVSENPTQVRPAMTVAFLENPPSLMELARATPQVVELVGMPPTSHWEKFSSSLDPLNPYWKYSVELPGVRPVHGSVNLTVELLKSSLERSSDRKPDLGWSPRRLHELPMNQRMI